MLEWLSRFDFFRGLFAVIDSILAPPLTWEKLVTGLAIVIYVIGPLCFATFVMACAAIELAVQGMMRLFGHKHA